VAIRSVAVTRTPLCAIPDARVLAEWESRGMYADAVEQQTLQALMRPSLAEKLLYRDKFIKPIN